MKPTPFLLVALSLASTTVAAPARAQRPSTIIEQDRVAGDRADELFRSGNVLAKKDRWTEAEPLFREAWTLKRSYDIAGNLGIAEAALGRWCDAAEHLSFALRSFPANGKPEHKKLLEATLAKALPQVAALRVKVTVDKAEVFVDGKSVGVSPLADAIFVEPGKRQIEAKLPGYETTASTFDAAKGSASELTLTMREATAPPPPTPPVKDTWRPGLPVLVTGGALAVVGLAVGAGLTAAANGKAADVVKLQLGQSSSCFAPGSSTAAQCGQLHDAAASKTTLSNAAASSFLVGGVLAATTGGLGIWAAMPRTVTVQAGPTVGAGQVGVTIYGAW
jgi:PEGA domain